MCFTVTRDLIIRCDPLGEEAIEIAKEVNGDSYERDWHELIKTGGNLNLMLDLIKAETDLKACIAPYDLPDHDQHLYDWITNTPVVDLLPGKQIAGTREGYLWKICHKKVSRGYLGNG